MTVVTEYANNADDTYLIMIGCLRVVKSRDVWIALRCTRVRLVIVYD